MKKLFIVASVFVMISCHKEHDVSNEDKIFIPKTEHKSLHTQIDKTLVAYYPFNGNAHDESGHRNDGVVFGATLTNDMLDHENSAYSFDGIDDYIEVSDNPNLDFSSGQFTISLWAKPSKVTVSSGDAIPFLTKESNTQFDAIALGIGAGEDIIFAASNDATDFQTLIRGEDIKSGNWYFVTVTQNGDNAHLYINGILIDIDITAAIPLNNNLPLLMGLRNDVSSVPGLQTRYYKGLLDEIRIYNRALSDEEIRKLYLDGQINKSEVLIDIKPGSDKNPINLNSKGVIPVAILTTSDFDVSVLKGVDITFGPNDAEECHGKQHFEDVDGDGDIDLMLHFKIHDTGITVDDQLGCITAELEDGTVVNGCDLITVIK